MNTNLNEAKALEACAECGGSGDWLRTRLVACSNTECPRYKRLFTLTEWNTRAPQPKPMDGMTPRVDACQGSDGTVPECEELCELARTLERELSEARESLQSEQQAHDHIASLCFAAGAESGDGTSVAAVKSLAEKLSEARAELDGLRRDKLQFLELYKLMPDIENQYEDRLYYHLANKLNILELAQQRIEAQRDIISRLLLSADASWMSGLHGGHDWPEIVKEAEAAIAQTQGKG